MLQVNDSIEIPEQELVFSAVRSQGAGGQNVNKVATAVQLRFNILQSSLPENIKEKILKFSDKRISNDGIITIKAQEYRSQARNRIAARERLRDIISRACFTRKRRLRTRIPDKINKKRLEDKSRRGKIKRLRSMPGNND